MRDLSKYMVATPIEFLEVVSLEAFDNYFDTVLTMTQVMAPTDPEAQELLTALTVSNEGFVETVKAIVEMILKWLAKLKEWWKQYFNEVTLGLVQLRMHAEGLLDLSADAISKRGKDAGPMKFVDRIPSLSIYYKPVTEITSYISALLYMFRTVKPYYDWMARAMEPTVSRLAGVLGGLRLDDFDEDDLNRLLGPLESVNPGKLATTLQLRAGEQDRSTLYSKPLLGNVSIALSGMSDADSIGAYNTIQLRLASTPNEREIPREVKFARFAANYSEQCLEQILEVIEYLQGVYSPASMGKREAILKALEASTKRLGQALSGNVEGDNDTKRNLEDALRLSKTLSNWLVSPYQELTTNTIRVLRAGCMVCKANATPDKSSKEAK